MTAHLVTPRDVISATRTYINFQVLYFGEFTVTPDL
jgi:hypothetical protein